METEILIIGQGISGTLLGWYLQLAQVPFLVIDNNLSNSASRVAAGIINPVTGRRIVKTWMIDQLLPFAEKAYSDFGKQFGIECIRSKKIIDCFPTRQMQESFVKAAAENPVYLNTDCSRDFSTYLQYHYGYGVIAPALVVDIKNILTTWRNYLDQNNLCTGEDFDPFELNFSGSEIIYKNIRARKIIFADGTGGTENKWFKNLPYAPNKGEALLIDAPALQRDFIYKKGITIAPVAENGFWVGSGYAWDYTDALPTALFYNNTKAILDNFLKIPYTITGHIAAIRPANLERRPFVGFHPIQKNIGIFNGMGAKGCSLAPYFANQLVQNILHNTPVHPLADVARFRNILSR